MGAISTLMLGLVILGMFAMIPIVHPLKSNSETSATQITSNAIKHNESDADQPEISEHAVTGSELEKLKQEVGVSEEGIVSNQMVNGHGTGLRAPTEEEWTKIAVELKIVDSVSLGAVGQLSSKVDWSTSQWFPPIGDQDGESSCVSWAITYYTKTFQEAKEHGWNLTDARWKGSYPTPEFQDKIISPAFTYHLTNYGSNSWTSYYDAINIVCSIGACSWAKMPWNSSDQITWPSENAWREAAYYRGAPTGYESMPVGTNDGILNLKNWIASGNLAVIAVDASQYSLLTSDDVWTADNYAGGAGHANTIVGYDDTITYTEGGQLSQGAFKIANSWGVGGWEHVPDGFYWISYRAMKEKVGDVMFYRDRIEYTPTLTSSFRIEHPLRGECDIIIGIGTHENPNVSKSFSRYIRGGDQPFCPNNIVFDISDFEDTVPTLYDKSYFISVYDGSNNATGVLSAFSVHSVVSGNPPVATVNHGKVFADVFLSHTINVPPDYSTMQGAINSVILGTDQDPGVIINVSRGTYRENVLVNKTLSIVGENPHTTFINCSYAGFEISANNVHIVNFTIMNCVYGILIFSSNNSILGNIVVNNLFGILLEGSSNDTLIGNAMNNNTFNFGVLGVISDDFLHSIDTSNLVNNKPIYYIKNQRNIVIDSEFSPDVGYLGLVGCSNVTVEGLNLTDNVNGILFADMQDSRIMANNIENNYVGSYVYNSVNISLTGNSISNNVNGTVVSFSNCTSICDNNIVNNQEGIQVCWCSNSSIDGNDLTGNWQGISGGSVDCTSISENNITGGYFGLWVYWPSNSSITGNTIMNNSIGLFLFGAYGNSISENEIADNSNGTVLEWSTNNTVFDNNVTENAQTGILVYSSSNNTINGNNITANDDGIEVLGSSQLWSSNNCIVGNNIAGNKKAGVSLGNYTTYTNILRNTISNNLNGTGLTYAIYTTISGNNITGNFLGIDLEWSSSYNNISGNDVENNTVGILSYSSPENDISNNRIAENQIGISLCVSNFTSIVGNIMLNNMIGTTLYSSNNTNISQNSISASIRSGIEIHWSCENSVFHNNFVDNVDHVYIEEAVHTTSWDDGYPSGGNYWSDYNGSDFFWGLHQNITGSDGIGDVMYIVDSNNKDHYPLMNPWTPPDITIVNLTASKTIVGQGYPLSLNVKVENQGSKVEGFNVTVFVNGTYVSTQKVILIDGNLADLLFTLNTTVLVKGNFTTGANVEPLQGETNTADNTCCSWVAVTIPGDIKGDFTVDIYDAILLSNAFNSHLGSPNWNANADINGDNIVDIYDAIILASHYNQHYP